MTEYSLRLVKTNGSVVDGPATFTALNYSKSINAPGALKLTFLDHEDENDIDLFTEDTRIQVWREPTGYASYLELGTVWFVTGAVVSVAENGKRSLVVTAKSALDLAARRIVAYSSGSAQATVAGAADNMIKRIINENIGPGAGSRAIPGLTVQGNAGFGSTVNKQVGWRNLLQSVQEIARDSEADGKPLYFDIVAYAQSGMEFRTWAGQPGVLRTSPVLSLDTGTLRSASWGFDRDDQVNVVWGLGPEFGGSRVAVTATATGVNTTPFSRRETTVEARIAGTGAPTAETQAEADAEMQRRQPKDFVVAEVANRGTSLYGVHWFHGDRLTISVGGKRYVALVESVSVEVNRSSEQVKATLRF